MNLGPLPLQRIMAELAARKQRRSLANFVEWAIEKALSDVPLSVSDGTSTIANEMGRLWALDEANRFIKLVTQYPDLMSYDEQVIWNVICEHQTLERGVRSTDLVRILRFKEGDKVDLDAVHGCWDQIKAYVLGTGTKKELDEVLSVSDWLKDQPYI